MLALILMTTVTSIALAQGGELVECGPQDQYCLDSDWADLGVYPININITETLVRLTPDFDRRALVYVCLEYCSDT